MTEEETRYRSTGHNGGLRNDYNQTIREMMEWRGKTTASLEIITRELGAVRESLSRLDQKDDAHSDALARIEERVSGIVQNFGEWKKNLQDEQRRRLAIWTVVVAGASFVFSQLLPILKMIFQKP